MPAPSSQDQQFLQISWCLYQLTTASPFAKNRLVPRAPLPVVGVTHKHDVLTEHLGRRYSSFVALTGSCARPNPSHRLGLSPRSLGLRRLSLVPAGRWPFPTLSLQSLCSRLDPYPATSLGCTCPFLLQELRPHRTGKKFGTWNFPCNATSTGCVVSRLQSFVYLQASTLARPPGCIYRSIPADARQPGRLHHA